MSLVLPQRILVGAPLAALASSAVISEPSQFLDALQKESVSVGTNRLKLRTPKREDMPSIFDIFKDPETVQYTWFVPKEGEPSWS